MPPPCVGSCENAYRKVSGSQTSAQVEFRNVRLGSSASDTPIEGKKYSYDGMGNITMISQSTGSYYPLIAYEYDSQNQLTKETYYDGAGTGSAHVTDTYEYTYDTAGNILSEKKNGTTTKTYTYGDSQWKDLLTAYGGRKIAYEGQTYNATANTVSGTAKSGNPIYYNNGKIIYSDITWQHGRQMTSVTLKSPTAATLIVSGTVTYTYNADGIRTSKAIPSIGKLGIINYTTHNYVTQNGKVVRETIGTGSGAKVLDFIYDESDRPFALKYSSNGGSSFTTYYYVLNLQGDVVKLISKSGTICASYTYDAWGKVLTATGSMENINPLRYRGYYYDSETGFYYLQSRYYDPVTHRFINADAPEYSTMSAYSLNDSNLFAYCGNNPVTRTDEDGEFWNFIVGAVVGAVVNAVSTAVEAVKEEGWSALTEGKTWAKIGVSAASGAINGIVAASGAGLGRI